MVLFAIFSQLKCPVVNRTLVDRIPNASSNWMVRLLVNANQISFRVNRKPKDANPRPNRMRPSSVNRGRAVSMPIALPQKSERIVNAEPDTPEIRSKVACHRLPRQIPAHPLRVAGTRTATSRTSKPFVPAFRA